jgi:hypothetical protein
LIGLESFLVETVVSETASTSLVALKSRSYPIFLLLPIFVRPSLFGRRVDSAGPVGRVVETLPQRLRGSRSPTTLAIREADLVVVCVSRRRRRLSWPKVRGWGDDDDSDFYTEEEYGSARNKLTTNPFR